MFKSILLATPVQKHELDLVPAMSTESQDYMDESRKAVVEKLKEVVGAAGDVEQATALFRKTDLDNSGEVDEEELFVLMEEMGIEIDRKGVHQLLTAVDVDGGGVIDEGEFIVLLKGIALDAKKKLRYV